MQATPSDKRKARRIESNFGILLFAEVSSRFLLQMVRNLSWRGLFLDCPDEDLSVGQKVFLEFDLPHRNSSKKIKAIARVVWRADGNAGAGLEFLRMHDLDRAFLADYLQTRPSVAC